VNAIQIDQSVRATKKLKYIRLALLIGGVFLPILSWSFSEPVQAPEPETLLESELEQKSAQKAINQHSSSQKIQSNNEQHIIITSRKSPLSGLAPTTQSTFTINPDKLPKIANSLTELVEGSPGVAENSQPGLFQVVSIRGVSRQRILTLLDGVRLSSERRAGTAASFIDPSLIQGVAITRGPASTYYGSGAMGGLMQLDLKRIFGNELSVGYDSVGDENFQSYSWGNEGESSENHLSLTKRKSNNSEDINNNPLNTHFEQVSGLYQTSNEIQGLDNFSIFNHSKVDSWLFSSKGTDLGRSNSRFPNRIVNITEESHHIAKTSISHLNQWSADFYLHDQSITTQTIRPNQSIIDVTNESQDFGINWQLGWDNSDSIQSWSSSNLIGFDLYTRRNVNSDESRNDFIDNNPVNIQTLDHANKDELAAFYSVHFKYNDLRLQAGGRYTSEQSKNNLSTSKSDTALTAFAGLALDIFGRSNVENHLELNANIGNAFRFPSLTELYFSGTTARGDIIGNAKLDAEKSTNFEIGFNWRNETNQLKMTLFENKFDQYIERVIIGTNLQGDDILTFVNQQDGKIKGLETEYQLAISKNIDLNFIATMIDGKNKQQEFLADIPSDRASISLSYHQNDWNTQLKLQHRRTKTNFGDGESPTQSSNLLSTSFQYQLNQHWLFKIVGENLFDMKYVGSADDLATLMPGRNFGFNVVWND
jgi:outer membrane receptor protein involved in Fe transport